MPGRTAAPKTIRKIGYIFASIAVIGAVIVESDADTGRWNAISNLAAIMMIAGVVPFAVIEAWLRHRTPKPEREVRDRLLLRGAPITLGFGSWILGFMIGVMFETLLLQLQYGFLSLIMLYAGVVIAF